MSQLYIEFRIFSELYDMVRNMEKAAADIGMSFQLAEDGQITLAVVE